MADLIDIDVWRGDNFPPPIWQFPSGVVLGGSTFDLTAYVGDLEVLSASTEDGSLIVDNERRRVIWIATSSQTRNIPYGRIAQYKLRRILVGNRQLVAYGYMTGLGGNPLDV